jgi:hypothetical protein
MSQRVTQKIEESMFNFINLECMPRKESFTGAMKTLWENEPSCMYWSANSNFDLRLESSKYPNYAADLLARKLTTDIIAVFLLE